MLDAPASVQRLFRATVTQWLKVSLSGPVRYRYKVIA